MKTKHLLVILEISSVVLILLCVYLYIKGRKPDSKPIEKVKLNGDVKVEYVNYNDKEKEKVDPLVEKLIEEENSDEFRQMTDANYKRLMKRAEELASLLPDFDIKTENFELKNKNLIK